ncbi:putative 4-deoxy-4-formamido-L-arabinose-phosphoundecaprenol deformylase ArnD [compost metagenome]
MPVYTIHAEVEGIIGAEQFESLIRQAAGEGITFCPLSQLLPEDFSTLPKGNVVRGELAGREGWLGQEQLLG